PADHAPPERLQVLGHAGDEPGLHVPFGDRTAPAHHVLGARLVLPLGGQALNATEVAELAGEHRGNLIQDSGEELHRGDLGVQGVRDDPPTGAHLELWVAHPEFGVGGDRGLHVAGHIDLGHHLDAILLGVGDDLGNVLLGVVPAVWPAVTWGGLDRAELALGAPGAHAGQAREL